MKKLIIDKNHFLDLGGKEWIKGDKERVYLTAEIFNKLFNTNLGDSNNNFFFDCKTNCLMRSYKNKKPTAMSPAWLSLRLNINIKRN
tara:strand:+ start:1130 stop:1390 length:261 start_codon:yes stop_codon:yes gene_type:complete